MRSQFAGTSIFRGLLRSGRSLRGDFEVDHYIILPQALPESLVRNWQRRALAVSKHARMISRSDGVSKLVYRVATGDVIRVHWPELFAFYQDNHTVGWVREVTGRHQVCPSEHIVSGVNLNILDSSESVYRWHFDAVPYTVLIYLTETLPENGGALELVPGCRRHEVPDLSTAGIVRHFPSAGTIVLMDGTRCYHRVAPMLRAVLRLSIPLVYTDAHTRPSGLDSYLYDEIA